MSEKPLPVPDTDTIVWTETGIFPAKLGFGWFLLRLTKPIASSFIWMLTYRSRRLRASQERQRQLSEFWKEEQERLWPMLKGSFEKVPEHWDQSQQLYAFAKRLLSAGITVKEINEAISISGHCIARDGRAPVRAIVLTTPDEAAQALRSGIKEIPPFERINTIRTVFK